VPARSNAALRQEQADVRAFVGEVEVFRTNVIGRVVRKEIVLDGRRTWGHFLEDTQGKRTRIETVFDPSSKLVATVSLEGSMCEATGYLLPDGRIIVDAIMPLPAPTGI